MLEQRFLKFSHHCLGVVLGHPKACAAQTSRNQPAVDAQQPHVGAISLSVLTTRKSPPDQRETHLCIRASCVDGKIYPDLPLRLWKPIRMFCWHS